MECRECNGRGVVLVDCEHNDLAVDLCWACRNEDGKIESECEYCEGYATVSNCSGCDGDGCDECDEKGVVPAV